MWKQSSKKKFDNIEQVYDYALSLLSVRDYSIAELAKKLFNKGAKQEFIPDVLAKLQKYGFIDEYRYAYKVLEAWKAKKYYGRQHLVAELKKKNVRKDFFDEVVASFTESEEAEHAVMASQIFIKKNENKIKEPDKKLYAAAVRFMIARGFSTRYVHVLIDKLHFKDDI